MPKITSAGRPAFAWLRAASALALACALAGCASVGASGPSTGRVLKASEQTLDTAGIRLIEVTDAVARQVAMSSRPPLFSDVLGSANSMPGRIEVGPGDVIDVTIIEAPPAVLFANTIADSQLPTMVGGVTSNVAARGVSRGINLPQQMVDQSGRISIPFAGSIQAAGRTLPQIQRDIAGRLRGKAHDPQVLVRLVTNATSNVTVIGDVGQSGRLPLSSRGERLLDALANAGGPKQAIGKTVVQVSRGERTFSLPLETIVRDPRQNVVLQPEDVVSVFYQPWSFTALGAIGNSSEVPFEGTGFTLAQALGRIGGLQDNRADIKGVFLFRLEDPVALGPLVPPDVRTTPEGRVPVIYRIDMRNPATFFIAQDFPIRNKDVLYVSNAPLADLAKFVNIVSSLTFTVVNVGNAVAE